MEKKIFAAVIAAVTALIIYNGGWEIIKFLGDKVFAYPWNFAAIIILSLITMALIIGTVVVPIGIYQKLSKKPLKSKYHEKNSSAFDGCCRFCGYCCR